MPKFTKTWKLVLQVVFFVLLYAGIQAYHKRNTVSGIAPTLQGMLLDGSTIEPINLRGKTHIVHFWASWCSICRLEQGSFNALAEDYPVITIASQSGAAPAVAEFVQEQGLKFPVLVDSSGQWAREYGVNAFPATFIVDGVGNIRFVEVGYTSEYGLRARMLLAQWLESIS